MTLDQLSFVLALIEHGREGAGYHTRLHLHGGQVLEGAIWDPQSPPVALSVSGKGAAVVRLDLGDDASRQTWIDVKAIDAVELVEIVP
jgi:hypothetical protein